MPICPASSCSPPYSKESIPPKLSPCVAWIISTIVRAHRSENKSCQPLRRYCCDFQCNTFASVCVSDESRGHGPSHRERTWSAPICRSFIGYTNAGKGVALEITAVSPQWLARLVFRTVGPHDG